MSKLRIAVTGINAVDNPGPGVGVIRSLKEDSELGVTAVGLAYDAMDPGIYMDWLVDQAFMIPYPSGTGEDYLARLLYIHDRLNLSMILPTLDSELPLFISLADKLERAGIRTFLPSREMYEVRDKRRLAEVADKIGLATPRTRAVSTHAELHSALEEIPLPVMIKGLYYKAFRAETAAAAIGCFDAVTAEWGYPALVQEIVVGDELNLVGLGDGQGTPLGMVGIKKLWTTSLGKIWNGVTIKNDQLTQAAVNFIKEYEWRGGFELECILAGDQLYMIEINPRFPAWVYFATGVGVNLPALQVRTALGLDMEVPSDYPAGQLYVRYTYEVVTPMAPFQDIMTKAERL